MVTTYGFWWRRWDVENAEKHIWPRFSAEPRQNMELLLWLRPEAKS